MFKISTSSGSVRPSGGRVTTTDDRYQVYSAGVTIERPEDPRGDSVNEVCLGARFDSLSELLADRRAKSDSAAIAERDGDVLVAQAVHDVPVTGLQSEPAAA